ncbi:MULTISPECIES: acyltransferase [Flavobacterium]|uniref:Transferase n=1 Tax=Flavobacterium panici TaxID=2654843 RepID=A0A9N8J982_9FLAO|nr:MULTISPECIES: transferase [Flavobacterium]UUF16833.1 transferase [Flavobacterium panici]CAC9976857.1 transferase [Flavobacterium panici]
MIRSSYRKLRSFYHKLKFYYSVNWTKTLYFNFKKFPFEIAKKLPVFFYNKVTFTSIRGEIIIEGKIKKGMIGFGQPYEINTRHKGIAEINITGKMVFKGHAQFGKDYFVFIGENGYCEFGNMAAMASNAKLICIEKIVLGNYVQLGADSQIIDTNFHDMIDTNTGEKRKKTGPVFIGNYNFSGSRISIMKNTKTPDFCTIATNSFCNKDYISWGNNILIGGIPAKLIRENISRDWEGEKDELDKFLTI